jgi:DNA primase
MTANTAYRTNGLSTTRRLTPIEIVKEAVPIEEYAATLTELHRGRGRCPIHGGDNDQAFAVYPDSSAGPEAKPGRWHCYRCDEGGDVVDLAAAVEGGGAWAATLALADRYGVDLPKRKPDRWIKHQDDKAKVREEMRRELAKVYQRRLYRMLHDPGAEPEDDEALWEGMYNPAYLAATRRVFG